MNGQENYLNRHPLLSLTSHEAPTLICIRSLNQHNMEFSDNYTGLLTRTRSRPKPNHIWNCDKSGNKKIVAGNRGGGLQDISDRSYFYVFHISKMYYLIGLYNSHEII